MTYQTNYVFKKSRILGNHSYMYHLNDLAKMRMFDHYSSFIFTFIPVSSSIIELHIGILPCLSYMWKK